MSDFDCPNHCGPFSSHEVRNGRCPECGERITTMDGKTDREWRMEERMEQREEERDVSDSDESEYE